MIKLESLGGLELRHMRPTALALGALLSTGGCSLVADFGSLDAIGSAGKGDGGDPNADDGDGGDDAGSNDDGGSGDDAGDDAGSNDDGGSGDSGADDGGSGGGDGGGTPDGGDGGGSDAGCTPQFPAELIAAQALSLCGNGIDDDCDGLADCEDPDCYTLFACGCTTYNGPSEAVCDDGLDDDCKHDGIDCEDPDCVVPGSCGCAEATYEKVETTCGDTLDNDCDGVADCDDDNCRLSTECCPNLALEGDATSCADGVDNDCDGLIDCADVEGCAGRLACCVPAAGQSGGETECADGQDDDCDGLVDCEDSDCATNGACCTATSNTETSCTNQQDEDCDGLVDCGDPDCVADAACVTCTPTGATETNCNDLIDDDCDGPIDCNDPDCTDALVCCQPTSGQAGAETSCGDDIDNDCDGARDCADSDCTGTAACCVPSAEEATEALCRDGVDNDCLGGIDCKDAKCGESTACCTPTLTPPQSESTNTTNATNGRDDDCNGEIDAVRFGFPQSFPHPGGASGAADVAILILPDEKATGIECRVFRRGAVAGAWGKCALQATPAGPVFTPHLMATPNGAYRAQVRWVFKGTYFTKYSEVGTYDYYTHTSLDSAHRCDLPGSNLTSTTDGKLIDFAMKYIVPKAYGGDDTMVFPTGGASDDTSLASPFIKLSFQEPRAFDAYALSGPSLSTYQVMSLRRFFRVSPDGRYLIMTRHYASTHNNSCYAATFRQHRYLNNSAQARDRYHCDAVVIHRTGAGVCINVASNGTLSLGHPFLGLWYTSPRVLMNGWDPNVNPVMGRQLTLYRGASSSYENFSDKCYTGPTCAAKYRLYVPDVAQFNWTP